MNQMLHNELLIIGGIGIIVTVPLYATMKKGSIVAMIVFQCKADATKGN